MKKRNFKRHKIKRTCVIKYNDYKKYRKDLIRDFNGRCGYCNLREDAVTTHFEIDHYIPKAVFENVRKELMNDYNNLVLCCKNCNLAKSNKYEGDINIVYIENKLFYNPVEIDYNNVFYRDYLGSIQSEDVLGKEMLEHLNLRRPLHNVAWLCEKLSYVTKEAKNKGLKGDSYLKLLEYENQMRAFFIANYNRKEIL